MCLNYVFVTHQEKAGISKISSNVYIRSAVRVNVLYSVIEIASQN